MAGCSEWLTENYSLSAYIASINHFSMYFILIEIQLRALYVDGCSLFETCRKDIPTTSGELFQRLTIHLSAGPSFWKPLSPGLHFKPFSPSAALGDTLGQLVPYLFLITFCLSCNSPERAVSPDGSFSSDHGPGFAL